MLPATSHVFWKENILNYFLAVSMKLRATSILNFLYTWKLWKNTKITNHHEEMYLLSWHKLYAHNPTLNEKYHRLGSCQVSWTLYWAGAHGVTTRKGTDTILFETIIVYFKERLRFYIKRKEKATQGEYKGPY